MGKRSLRLIKNTGDPRLPVGAVVLLPSGVGEGDGVESLGNAGRKLSGDVVDDPGRDPSLGISLSDVGERTTALGVAADLVTREDGLCSHKALLLRVVRVSRAPVHDHPETIVGESTPAALVQEVTVANGAGRL